MDTITAHTNYIVLAPEKPTNETLLKKVSQVLADIEEISEAHLPHVIQLGTNNAPVLTLFAVVSEEGDYGHLQNLLNTKINGGFFRKNRVAVKIISQNFPLMQSIKDANCLVGWRD